MIDKNFLVFLIFLLSSFISYSDEDPSNFWYRSNANNESTKFSPYDQINKTNIFNLIYVFLGDCK